MHRPYVVALAMGLLLGASIVYGTAYTASQSQLATLHTSIAALQSHIDRLTHQQYEDVLNLTAIVDAAEDHYTAIALQFLDRINYTVGDTPVNSTTIDAISATVEYKVPNYKYHEWAELELPDLKGNRLCWIITTFHYWFGSIGGYVFTFWVDVSTGHVIGGTYAGRR